MNATKNHLEQVTNRRLKAQRNLEAAARAELARKVQEELDADPQVKKLHGTIEKLKDQLHRKRVEKTRKDFALKIRQKRLESIPEEIRTITVDRAGIERKIAQLEEADAKAKARLDEIRQRVTRKLKASGEVLAIEHPAA